MIKELLIRLRDLVKRYAIEDSPPIPEKLVFFFEILPRMNDLVNQTTNQKFRSRLLLQVYHLVLLISSLGRSNPGWRLLGGANILSSILIGLPEWVPDIDILHLQQVRRFEEIHDLRYFLTISMGVYIECILTLENVEYKELLKWGSSVIFYGEMYQDFFDQIDLELLAGKAKEPYALIRQYFFPLWNYFVFLHNILRMFGERWPNELSGRFGRGIESAVKCINHLKNRLNKVLDLVNRLYNNTPSLILPQKSSHIQRLYFLQIFLEIYSEEINQYQKKGKDFKRMRSLLLNLLSQILNFDGGFDPSSPLWAYYYDVFNLLLEIGNPEDILQVIFSCREKMVMLFYKKFRLEVLQGEPMNDEDLTFLKNTLQYTPNELIDILIFESLNNFRCNQMEKFHHLIKDIEQLGERKLVPPTSKLLKNYCMYLKTGDERHFPPTLENPFDANSWYMNYQVSNSHGKRRYYSFGTRLLKIQGIPIP